MPNRDPAIILHERALRLATPPPEKPSGETVTVLRFELGGQRYGIETSIAREVVALRRYTPVPGTPSFVLGIVNHHGEILSVVDLHRYCRVATPGLTNLNTMIVVEGRTMRVGVLCDRTNGIETIPQSELRAESATIVDGRAEYIRGTFDGGALFIDMEKILGEARFVVQ